MERVERMHTLNREAEETCTELLALCGDQYPDESSTDPAVSHRPLCPTSSCSSATHLIDDHDASRTERIQGLRRRLKDIADAILDLCAEHNASRPVSRLPVEVMAIIFHLSQISRTQDHNYGPPWVDTTWSPSLTQVCVSWREIALNTPSLWNCLPLDKLHLALALSRRFDNHLLRIRESGMKTWNGDASVMLSNILAKNTARIAEIRIGSRRGAVVRTVLDGFDQLAPVLQTLSLVLPDKYDHSFISVMESICRLRTPALQHLKLMRAPSPAIWRSSLLRSPGLRYLHLQTTFEDVLADALDVLGSLPLLERLRVRGMHNHRHCHAIHSDQEMMHGTSTQRRVCETRMRSLRRLSVYGATQLCIDLLDSLKPSLPLRGLSIHCHTDCTQHSTNLWQLIEPYIRASSLSLTVEDSSISLGSLIPDAPDGGRTRDPVRVRFERISQDDVKEIFARIGSYLGRSEVSSLRLHFRGLTAGPSLTETLSNWSSLRHVDLYHEAAAEWFLHAIHTAPSSSAPPLDRASMILPNLSSLQIVKADAHDGSWYRVCRAEIALRCRTTTEDGGPYFRSLTFNNCEGISELELAALKDSVPELEISWS
ncbi:hypothetical protein PUNSTDRAFT_133474 [Punctularia strigosozonata HHB-11173 SS5]|uniref:uncharacterized protein n=1 Tax=Punctularia strigosozonata (strain HHB-11173) TaxID=741275 RepID=UPI00044176BB|nr:uncharacterized protein PUNSTDRAFT_133474 [Punctularia strigosozonata HHB-11173 SS5]EIN09699.1 hypothetical protein PUNSTDRAFT_133474 [Punctularia strigosozonata HHB-11173 SS5]